MLHDAPAKSQNPIKNALRRRNAKSVAFAPTQYFEYTTPSDESEEEGEGEEGEEEGEEADVTTAATTSDDDITLVEPLEITPRSVLKPTLAIDTGDRGMIAPLVSMAMVFVDV